MAAAYFCDRCGNSYSVGNVTRVVAYRDGGAIRRLGGDLKLESADLCPKCILKLDEWIKEGEDNE